MSPLRRITMRRSNIAVLRCATVLPNPTKPPREIFILGQTPDGRAFRPSDWAERLAGAMSSFRPGGAQMGRSAYIGYSPYCVPNSVGGVKCVVVNEALREIEPMAWDFVMSFARDNQLQVGEACSVPDVPPMTPKPSTNKA